MIKMNLFLVIFFMTNAITPRTIMAMDLMDDLLAGDEPFAGAEEFAQAEPTQLPENVFKVYEKQKRLPQNSLLHKSSSVPVLSTKMPGMLYDLKIENNEIHAQSATNKQLYNVEISLKNKNIQKESILPTTFDHTYPFATWHGNGTKKALTSFRNDESPQQINGSITDIKTGETVEHIFFECSPDIETIGVFNNEGTKFALVLNRKMTTGWKSLIRLIDSKKNTEENKWPFDKRLTCVAFSPRNKTIAFGSTSKELHFLNTTNDTLHCVRQNQPFSAIAYVNSGKVAIGGKNSLGLYDPRLDTVFTLMGHQSAVYLKLRMDGDRITAARSNTQTKEISTKLLSFDLPKVTSPLLNSLERGDYCDALIDTAK